MDTCNLREVLLLASKRRRNNSAILSERTCTAVRRFHPSATEGSGGPRRWSFHARASSSIWMRMELRASMLVSLVGATTNTFNIRCSTRLAYLIHKLNTVQLNLRNVQNDQRRPSQKHRSGRRTYPTSIHVADAVSLADTYTRRQAAPLVLRS